jgi:predicted RNase H-like HicB family nuclease
MKKILFNVLLERDEDGYRVATVPALKSCYPQVKTMKELMSRIKEVIELCLQDFSSPGSMGIECREL